MTFADVILCNFFGIYFQYAPLRSVLVSYKVILHREAIIGIGTKYPFTDIGE